MTEGYWFHLPAQFEDGARENTSHTSRSQPFVPDSDVKLSFPGAMQTR